MDENRTLLIVDDEPETLKGYTDFLVPQTAAPARKSSRQSQPTPQPSAQLEKYNLLLASSGEEAIKLFEKELKEGRRVAAGFFDVKLGSGMDGLATIQAIKALDKDIHCVVVTAYHDRTVEEINSIFGEEFKDQWDYLNKPFTQGEILQKARQMVSAWNRRRQLEILMENLAKSERLAAIGQVARGIGHEFGNILLRIMGKLDIALSEKNPEKIAAHLQVALKAADRAGVIVRNLQSFSKATPYFQHEKLRVPLEESLSLLSHEFVKSSVKLDLDLKEVPPMRIDSGGLAQVFLNIMLNAIHAMPQGGNLKVTLGQVNNSDGKAGCGVAIKDTGPGIQPDVLPKIFDYAFTTKGDKGSGLGLSVSQQIVESHGGKISVKTEVGKGTEFLIWLPQT